MIRVLHLPRLVGLEDGACGMVLGQVEGSLQRGLGNEKIINEELTSDIDRDNSRLRDQVRRHDRVLLDRRGKVRKAGRPGRGKDDSVVEGLTGFGGVDPADKQK